MSEECRHPDPKTIPWLFCRTCGHWIEGVRIGDGTDDVLKESLREHVRKTRYASTFEMLNAILEPLSDQERVDLLGALPYCKSCGRKVEPDERPCQCDNDD